MKLKALPYVCIRIPLQSIDKVSHFNPNELPETFEKAVYIASTEFWHEYKKWLAQEGEEKEQNNCRITQTLFKYWLRSCTRCTPFGTFAGCSLVPITDKTRLVLNCTGEYNEVVRMDMEYLVGLVNELTELPHLQEQISYYPNNSIYRLFNTYRYTVYTVENGIRKYSIESVPDTSYVTAILQKTINGSTIDELVIELMKFDNVDYEQAYSFIREMINTQLLYSELELNITGNDALDTLIHKLKRYTGIEDVLHELKIIKEGLKSISSIGSRGHFSSVIKKIDKDVKSITQTDLIIPANDLSVNRSYVDEIVKQVSELSVLGRKLQNGELERFRRSFEIRYEGQEVSLLHALDAESGIGYAGISDEFVADSDVINDLYTTNGVHNEGKKYDALHEMVMLKYDDFRKNKKAHIVLVEKDIARFKAKNNLDCFPNNFCLNGSFLRDISQEQELNTPFFYFSGISGPSAVNMLGRFAYANDNIEKYIKDILLKEEQEYPDAIYAEIVHLSQSRIGNIIFRPVLRKYEIPYVSISGAEQEHQILLDDILVSVYNGEIILKSKKHKKRIFPRLTNAHNFIDHSLPIYKFLCDLQYQNSVQSSFWDWGPLGILKNLPRVVYKNIVLKRATYVLEKGNLDAMPGDKRQYVSYMLKFCELYQVPKKLIYVDGDNELFIDVENADCIELLLFYLNKHGTVQLEEFLFTDNNGIVTDEKGSRYANEVIIPIENCVSAKSTVLREADVVNIKRDFLPSQEWLYFKIYCGVGEAENFLKNTLSGFIEQGIEKGMFEKFFFLRYRDDLPHIRIRFFNPDKDMLPVVQKDFMRLLEPLVEIGTISKVILDTYSRELERYDPLLIEEAESLFYNDSLAVLRLLNISEYSANRRMLLALRAIDMLLSDFSLTLPDRADLLLQMKDGYFKEFGGDPLLQKQLNQKYRKCQMDIFSHLNPKKDIPNMIYDPVSILKIRCIQNKDVVNAITHKLHGNILKKKLFELLPSYIHMFMNRFFLAKQRKYELVIYFFLEKYYRSCIAINKLDMNES